MARETLVTVAEVAEMTTLAESTLYDWRAKEKGPRSFKLNGRVVYIEREVVEWIAAQQETTSRGGES
jgi:predicted DNA-binding transcriptional regulator AlpA